MSTYTVKRGDTLYAIAKANGTTVSELVKLNNITDPNYIVVGQQISLTSGSSGTGSSGNINIMSSTNTSSRVTIKVFGLQSNTDRTVYVTWDWSRSSTQNYQVKWYYDTGDGVWFLGSDSNVEEKQSTYTAPSNAKRVKVIVKPVSTTRYVDGNSVSAWTAGWSTEKIYDFSNNPPSTPGVPSVSLDKYKLIAILDNIDPNINATVIQFQVIKDYYTVFQTSNTTLRPDYNYARYSCYVDAGSEYKVRCRARRGDSYSDWSEYSDTVTTIPSTPGGITVCRATSETSVYLEWTETDTAKSYDLEYTTKREYFDSSDKTSTVSSIETTRYEKTGLESGQEYFFRVRAVNDNGYSAWSEIKSLIIGKKPAAPTTWSSTTTAITGDQLILYWVHNTEDGSSQTYAELEVYVDGVPSMYTIQNSTDEEEKDKTSTYKIDTSKYIEGTKIQWRVRTAGITNVFGDWSVQRTVDIYAPATLELSVTDSSGEALDTLKTFPFYISGTAGPKTQIPTGYHLSVISNSVYETVDIVGNPKMINSGDTVYSKYFDTTDPLLVELSAGNIDLENNINYTVTCTVSMNSGLTAESSIDFTVAWAEEMCEPNCEIGIDNDTYTAIIRPYCQDLVGKLIEDVSLSVYRREFDGKFTELIGDIDNEANTFITDPHPALDYARYRIVARSKTTGAVSYYDPPGYPVGGKAVIIQWDEAWSSFDTDNEDEFAEPSWSGSILKLPYNIDVSDSHRSDVALVEYIGRSHPISYYGTQLGETSTWNVDIEKDDEETLYALRRLAKWMGDVYVREPSGSGYWANITVSFSQKHCELVIPVTLSIVRVEGGV